MLLQIQHRKPNRRRSVCTAKHVTLHVQQKLLKTHSRKEIARPISMQDKAMIETKLLCMHTKVFQVVAFLRPLLMPYNLVCCLHT